MKFSATFALSGLAAVAAAQSSAASAASGSEPSATPSSPPAGRPSFLNTAFDVVSGQPFELKYNNCDAGCTISLVTGESANLQPVEVLTSDATGDSVSVTVSGVPSSSYAFKITSNANGLSNYSDMFSYVNSGSVTVSAPTGSATSASTGASSAVSSTPTPTPPSSSHMKSSAASKTKTHHHTTTTAPNTSIFSSDASSVSTPLPTTTVPGVAGRVDSPIALVAGAVAAMVIFN